MVWGVPEVWRQFYSSSMNSGKIVADGWTDGWTGRGFIRGPRGPKKLHFSCVMASLRDSKYVCYCFRGITDFFVCAIYARSRFFQSCLSSRQSRHREHFQNWVSMQPILTHGSCICWWGLVKYWGEKHIVWIYFHKQYPFTLARGWMWWVLPPLRSEGLPYGLAWLTPS